MLIRYCFMTVHICECSTLQKKKKCIFINMQVSIYVRSILLGELLKFFTGLQIFILCQTAQVKC